APEDLDGTLDGPFRHRRSRVSLVEAADDAGRSARRLEPAMVSPTQRRARRVARRHADVPRARASSLLRHSGQAGCSRVRVAAGRAAAASQSRVLQIPGTTSRMAVCGARRARAPPLLLLERRDIRLLLDRAQPPAHLCVIEERLFPRATKKSLKHGSSRSHWPGWGG